MEIMKILAIATPFSYLIDCVEKFVLPGGFMSWHHSLQVLLSKQKSSHYLRLNVITFAIFAITEWFAFFNKDSNSSLAISASFLACNAIFTHIN